MIPANPLKGGVAKRHYAGTLAAIAIPAMVLNYKTAIIIAKLHQTNRPVQQQDSSRSWEIQTVPNRKALVFLLWD